MGSTIVLLTLNVGKSLGLTMMRSMHSMLWKAMPNSHPTRDGKPKGQKGSAPTLVGRSVQLAVEDRRLCADTIPEIALGVSSSAAFATCFFALLMLSILFLIYLFVRSPRSCGKSRRPRRRSCVLPRWKQDLL